MSTALSPLWSISEEVAALLDSVETCPEELLPELQQQLDKFLGQEVEKVDQIAHVLSALDYEQRCAADEIARLQDRKKTAKAAQDRLEQYVCRVISMRGVKALKGKTNTLSVRPSDGVKITDEAAIPDQWKVATVKMPANIWRTVVEVYGFDGVTASVEVSKAAVKKDLKAGIVIPGADLEYRSNLARK